MRHLIFDFDGTIVDSGPLIYSSLVEYTDNSSMTWKELRNLPSDEVISALEISHLDLPKLILKIRNEFKNKISDQPIIPGIKEALIELKKRHFHLHIVSSNSEENIEVFLKNHALFEVFDSITSFFTIFGKAYGIDKLLKKIKCNSRDAIYIGDETRDIQAANKANIQCLAVTWGYNTEKALKPYRPNFMAKTPQELLSILCKDLEVSNSSAELNA